MEMRPWVEKYSNMLRSVLWAICTAERVSPAFTASGRARLTSKMSVPYRSDQRCHCVQWLWVTKADARLLAYRPVVWSYEKMPKLTSVSSTCPSRTG